MTLHPLPRSGSAGVTLIELVAVLAILAAATALVVPAVGRGTEALRLRTEAGRVATLLRDARVQAVSHRQAARVTVERGGNAVSLSLADRPVRSVEVPPGLRLVVDGGNETLTFSSRGLTRETRWVLEGRDGRRLRIEIEGVSGRVTVGPERS